jgi:5,10-methylenetetrahydromethanopterin reductase
MDISCAFATSPNTPEHIALAERLGYRRAWCYDSPALYPDVWVTLALAAQRTSRIGLGPGVLIPSLRHVMTNAAAIATLENLAPGRLVVAVGSGFTGRLTLGQQPLRWRFVGDYIRALRGLLRGEEVEWEGGVMRMLHPTGFAPPRPVEVPLLVGADGPKGLAVAREFGDGIFTTRPQAGFSWIARLITGTVLDAGESPAAERVMLAAGHSGAVAYHGAYARGGDLDALPGGAEWRRLVEQFPERTRHLATHEGHLVHPNAIDRQVLSGELLARLRLAAEPAGWQARLAEIERAGCTEIAYQPAGPDIERELTVFARVAGLAG